MAATAIIDTTLMDEKGGGGDGSGQSGRHRRCDCLLTTLDHVISFFVLAPLCVFFWRGTWQTIDGLQEASVIGGDGVPKYVGPIASVLFGHTVCFLLTLCQRPIGSVLGLMDDHKPDDHSTMRTKGAAACVQSGVVRLALSRTYTALYAFALVNQWRGVWQLLELYAGKSWQSGAGVTATGALALAATRTLRNIMAPPLIVMPDLLDVDYVRTATIFGFVPDPQRKKQHSHWMSVLDASVSVVYVGTLVVFVWRGLWTLLDALLYAGSPKRSGFSSLAIGYTLVTAASALQRPAAALSARSSELVRVLFEDVFLFTASFGAINVWRGVWMLADVYIYPDDYEFSNWFTSVLGFTTSLLLFASNNILARGVLLDGKRKDGSGCIFHSFYLRKILARSRMMSSAVSNKVVDGVADVQRSPVTRSVGKVNGGLMWTLTPPHETTIATVSATAEKLSARDGMTSSSSQNATSGVVPTLMIEMESIV